MCSGTRVQFEKRSLQGSSLRLKSSLRRKLYMILSHTVNICIQTKGRPGHCCGAETLGSFDMAALMSTAYIHSKLYPLPRTLAIWPVNTDITT